MYFQLIRSMDAYTEMGGAGSHDLIGLLADCLCEGLCTCSLAPRAGVRRLQARKHHYAFKYQVYNANEENQKHDTRSMTPLCSIFIHSCAEVEKIFKFNFLHLTEKFNYIIIDRVFQSMLNSSCGIATVCSLG